LAEILNPGEQLWAVDKLILAYLAFTGFLIAFFWNHLPNSGELLAMHLGGAALIVLAARRKGRASWIFRHWYPLPYVALCYKEMAILIPSVRHTNADQWLASLDHRLWGVNPTVWLEGIENRPLTEFLQLVYTVFVPVVLLIAWLIWKRGRYADFRYYAFLIALGFLASYIGYLIVPARGPRFLLSNLQNKPLRGLWLFDGMQTALDRLESAHYDCFPSGHTELTILAWWSSRQISSCLFWLYFSYTLGIIFATVYLRYHYTIDLLAGALLAFVLVVEAPAIYQKLSGERDRVGRN
jgi:membrane-associated phospholipid phosphatase